MLSSCIPSCVHNLMYTHDPLGECIYKEKALYNYFISCPFREHITYNESILGSAQKI